MARIPQYSNESFGYMGKLLSEVFMDSYPGGPDPGIKQIKINLIWREDFLIRRWFRKTWTDDYCYNDWIQWLLDLLCFTEGTQVKMYDGSFKNIEDVQVGDLVEAYDADANQTIAGIVTKTVHHDSEEMDPYYLLLNDEIGVTPNHYFTINGRFIPAEMLCEGITIDSDVEISSIEQVFEKTDTYDLWVEPYVEGGRGMMLGGDSNNSNGGSHELGGIPSTPLNRVLLPYGIRINESIAYPTKTPLTISEQIQVSQEMFLKFFQIEHMINCR
jgi:hypothetical protein